MNDFFKNISSGLDELATIKREKPSPYRGELFFGAAREITVVYFDKEIKFSISNKNTPDLSLKFDDFVPVGAEFEAGAKELVARVRQTVNAPQNTVIFAHRVKFTLKYDVKDAPDLSRAKKLEFELANEAKIHSLEQILERFTDELLERKSRKFESEDEMRTFLDHIFDFKLLSNDYAKTAKIIEQTHELVSREQPEFKWEFERYVLYKFDEFARLNPKFNESDADENEAPSDAELEFYVFGAKLQIKFRIYAYDVAFGMVAMQRAAKMGSETAKEYLERAASRAIKIKFD